MSQYHRHLDHDWQAARRETNYALFGNSRGRTVAKDTNWCIPRMTDAERRAEWWRIKHCIATVKREYRAASLTWLRYKELEV